MKVYAVVHTAGTLWLRGDISGTLNYHYDSLASLREFVKLLIDAGIEVRGYWRDVDYSHIDKRISSEKGRV